jgi:hypothetical protein
MNRPISGVPVFAGVAAGVLSLVVTGLLAAAAGATSPGALQAAKAASARYHSFEQAEQAGYSVAGEPCVASPLGAMGVHASNAALMADDALDPLRPEILLYLPDAEGTLTLLGVEYFKADADQSLATDGDRPSLFGVPFNGPMPGHNPTMPIHYDLHVWFWQDNPSGLFALFNPAISCP